MRWLSKNKHSFLDPRGWPFFPRPALRETLGFPRSPALAVPFFLRGGSSAPRRPAGTLSAFAEQVYTALRVKPDIETVPLSPVQRCAFSSSIVPGHLDLIKGRPSGPFLHLVNHVLEFDRADITTEEHALSFDLFPVVAPGCLADRAALLRHFQSVYSSPNAPSNTDQNNQST